MPLFHRPLAAWALEACANAGITRFAVNTHHLPAAWEGFGSGHDLTLFHEPILLETGGGLKNISRWMCHDSVLVHNGEIFSTLPLRKLIAAHEASGLPVTLALRSEGVARHIALDPSSTRVIEKGATVQDSVLWPGSRVAEGAVLERCIVFSSVPATGFSQDADL